MTNKDAAFADLNAGLCPVKRWKLARVFPEFDHGVDAVDAVQRTARGRRHRAVGRQPNRSSGSSRPEGHYGHVSHLGWSALQPPVGGGGVLGPCFVAMAFADDMEEAFDNGIRPAVFDCGLTTTHVGRIQFNDSINDVILAGIRAAQVVIADVTHQRNGVYFEGGFGMGLGRAVIWMCKEDDLQNVHFDTRHCNHIVWSDHNDLRTKLSDRLRGTLRIPVQHL